MKNTLLIAAATLLAGIGAANAQSNSQSGAANNTHVTAIVQGATLPAMTTTNSNQSGHLYTTPAVPGGAYFAGTNPCLVGVGAGGAGGPIGFSLSFGKNDDACTRRSNAAAFHSLGMDDVAIAIMLQDADVKKAYMSTGRLTPGMPVATPVIQPALPSPVVDQRQEQIQIAPVVVLAKKKIPSWCAHAAPTITKSYYDFMCK